MSAECQVEDYIQIAEGAYSGVISSQVWLEFIQFMHMCGIKKFVLTDSGTALMGNLNNLLSIRGVSVLEPFLSKSANEFIGRKQGLLIGIPERRA